MSRINQSKHHLTSMPSLPSPSPRTCHHPRRWAACATGLSQTGPVSYCHRQGQSVTVTDRARQLLSQTGPVNYCHRQGQSVTVTDRARQLLSQTGPVSYCHRQGPSVTAISFTFCATGLSQTGPVSYCNQFYVLCHCRAKDGDRTPKRWRRGWGRGGGGGGGWGGGLYLTPSE